MSVTHPTNERGNVVDDRLEQTRRLVRNVDLMIALLTLATVVFALLFVAVLADHWGFKDGLPIWLRIGFFGGAILGIGWYAYRRILPLFLNSINPVYAAQVLEQSSPSLKNTLINWILLRRERTERGVDTKNQLADRMFDGVAQSAASTLSRLPADRAIDWGHVQRWVFAFAAIFLILFVYAIFSPKSLMTSIARLMLPLNRIDAPQAVQFLNVQPGDITVQQGDRLNISSEVVGPSREQVYVYFNTDDGRAVRQAVPMSLPEGATRFEAPFPPGKQGFVCGVDYWIQQGESRSPNYRIIVRPTAALEVVSLTYHYPAYTGKPDETVEDTGDIKAVDGTEVKLVARSTVPLDRAVIVFDNDPKQTLRLTIDSDDPQRATVLLKLESDPKSLQPTTVRSYTFRATDKEGYESRRSGIFRIEILPDKPPTIQWGDDEPRLKDGVNELTLPLNTELNIPVHAEDPDFGLRYVRFRVESGNKRINPIDLLESQPTGPVNHTGPLKLKTVFSPVKSRLAVGDVAEFWAEATDSKFPDPNVASTRRISVKIVDPQEQKEQPKPEEKPKNDEQKQSEKNKSEDSKDENPNDDKKEQDDSADPPRNEKNEKDSKDPDKQDDAANPPQDKNKEKNTDDVKQQDHKDDPKNGDEKDAQKNPDDDRKDDEKSEDGRDEKSSENKENGEKDDSPPKNGEMEKKDEGPKKPINPETNSGDAMEKIVEQMKKEGKLPDDPKKENAAKSEKKDKNEPCLDCGKKDCDGACRKDGGDKNPADTPRNQAEKSDDKKDGRKNEDGSSPNEKSEKNDSSNEKKDAPKKEDGSKSEKNEKKDKNEPCPDCGKKDCDGACRKGDGDKNSADTPRNQAEKSNDSGDKSANESGETQEEKPSGQQEKNEQAEKNEQSEKQEKQQQDKKEPCPECGKKECSGECQGGGKKEGQEEQEGQGGQGGQPGQGSGGKPGEDKGEQSGSGSGGEKQQPSNKQGGKEGNAQQESDDAQGNADNQEPGGGKESGGKGSGGSKNDGNSPAEPGSASPTNSDAPPKKGNAQGGEKQDMPVDPNDDTPRDRDNSLDPNSDQRREKGSDSSNPKKLKDDPKKNAGSGVGEGQGKESSPNMEEGQGDDFGKARDPQEATAQRKVEKEQADKENQTGEPTNEEGDPTGEGTQSKNSQQKSNRPGEQTAGKAEQGGKPHPSKDGGKPSEQLSDEQGGDNPTTNPVGGSPGAPAPTSDTVTEDANLEYTQRVTNLVLEYLEDQLKNEPNPELLKELGWTKDDLRAFAEKWKKMSEQGQAAEKGEPDFEAWKEALKSIGLTPKNAKPKLNQGRTEFKDNAGATETQRYVPPKSLEKRFKNYTQGIGK